MRVDDVAGTWQVTSGRTCLLGAADELGDGADVGELVRRVAALAARRLRGRILAHDRLLRDTCVGVSKTKGRAAGALEWETRES